MFPDEDKTKDQVISKLTELRQRVTEFEMLESGLEWAEQMLRENEERYRAIFQQAADSIVLVDAETGALVEFNNKAHENLGYSHEEFAKLKIPDFEVIESAEEVANHIEKIAKEGSDVFETQHRTKDGEIRDIQVSSRAICVEGRTFVQSIWRDITERKRVEEEMRVKDNAIASSINAIAIADLKGNLTYVNHAFLRMWGCDDEKEILGKNAVEFWRVAEEAVEVMQVAMDRGGWVGELVAKRKDGSFFDTQVSTSIVVDETGKPIRRMASFIDITERKEAEELYRTLANSSPVGVYIVQDGKFQFVNPQFQKYTGYTEDELLGTYPLSIIHPEDRERVRENAVEMLKGERLSPYEFRYIGKSGETIWAMETVTSIYYRGKRATLGNFMDITERKQAEEALKESKRRYLDLVNFLPQTIFELDERGNLTFANRQGTLAFGYTLDDVKKGLTDEQMFIPEDRDRVVENRQRILNGEELGGIEYTALRKDGSMFPAMLFYVPIRRDDKIVGLRGILIDITERKQAEEALRESEERYRALVNLGGTVGEAVVMLQDTEQGNAIQTFVSDEWPRITGYSREELLSMSFFDLLHPRYRQASLERHGKKMRGAIMPGLFEMSIIRKDGTEVPIELTSAYTTYKGERANVAFIRDITERKRAEEREKELQQELNLSRRLASVGELAAGVAHELNNPLTGIIGFSERLLRKSTSQEISRDLERIHNEAQRAARVVENLRTFARRPPPQREYLDINETLGRTLELSAYELRTGDIELTVELTPDLTKIIADFGQIQQVFLNIIRNAEQAITEANGGGKLTIKTEKRQDCVRISFADDGPGISAEHLDKLFDPFFTTRGEQGGTGLGLSVCHGIVTEHGGRIYAKSKPGKGATFFVELPVAPEEIDESEVAEEEPVRSRR